MGRGDHVSLFRRIDGTDRAWIDVLKFDVVYNEITQGHEFSHLHTVVLGIDLTDRLGTFIEYIGIVGETPYEAYGSGGFAFSVSDHLILDCGAQIGLNRARRGTWIFCRFYEAVLGDGRNQFSESRNRDALSLYPVTRRCLHKNPIQCRKIFLKRLYISAVIFK